MRKSALIRSAIATATVTVGLAAGAASAAASNTATVPPDIDIAALMDTLTPEQMTCLVQNVTTIDTEDINAVFGVLETCEIDLATLMTATSGTSTGTTDSIPVEPLVGALALLGIDQDAEICIAASTAVTPPADDNAALVVLQSCGVSLVDVVTRIGSGEATAPAATDPAATGSTGNPIADMLADELAKQGITLSNEQLVCMSDSILADPTAFASEDMGAIMGLLESCGISLTDLLNAG